MSKRRKQVQNQDSCQVTPRLTEAQRHQAILDVLEEKVPEQKLDGRCRDCSLEQAVAPNEWAHRASPRCLACGGIIDRITPLLKRRSIPKGTVVIR